MMLLDILNKAAESYGPKLRMLGIEVHVPPVNGGAVVCFIATKKGTIEQAQFSRTITREEIQNRLGAEPLADKVYEEIRRALEQVDLK